MESLIRSACIFRFGQFEADTARNTLTRNGSRIKIQDQPYRVLLLLLESQGEIVSREVLRQQLWPDGIHVDFDGSLNVILKKLRAALDDDADNPRFVETVPRRGYRFIAPISQPFAPGAISSLGPAPERVSSDAGSTVGTDPGAASEGQDSGGNPGETPPIPVTRIAGRFRPLLTVSVTIVILLVAAGWTLRGRMMTFLQRRNLTQTAQAAPVPVRKSVAVLGFHNVSGKPDDAWLSTGLSEMLSTELAGGDNLRLVPGEAVANLWVSAPWSQTDTLNQETTARIGAALNSDFLILGAYTTTRPSHREQIRLDVRLQDAKSGEILAEVAEISGAEDVYRLVSRVGGKLRVRLGVPGLGDAEQAGVFASMPGDADAARFYSLGLEKLRQFDALAAKNLLEQAVLADPKFPLAHAMLAQAWSQLGYEQNRKKEAKRALDLSAGLPRGERLVVEGDYYEALGNHDKAASIYSVLFQLFPDNVDHGLQLANSQTLGAHASEARATIAQLRKLPEAASGDPRIDLAEARIAPDTPSVLELVRKALTKSLARDARLIAAQARKQECTALVYGDQQAQAMPVCEDAYHAYLAAGNHLGAADSLRLIGDLLEGQGHPLQARQTYESALGMLKKLGEHEKTGAVLNNMALGFENEGKLGHAEQLFRQAMANFVIAGDRPNQVNALSNIADVQFMRGDLRSAGRLYQQGLELVASLDVSEPGYLLFRQADLQLAQGLPEEAREGAEQAIESMRPAKHEYREMTSAMMTLGDVLLASGDLAGARKQYEEVLAMRQQLGEADLVAETQLAMANLLLAEGQPEKVESLIRPILPELAKEKSDPASAGAYLVLGRAELQLGKVREATADMANAGKFAASTPDPAIRLPLSIQQARVTAAGEAGAQARTERELLSTAATARKLGYYRIELDARQALAELQLKTNPRQARSQLSALSAEARNRGLGLVARQSEQLMAESRPTAQAKSGN